MNNNTLLLSELLQYSNIKSNLNEDQILILKKIYEENKNTIINIIKNGFTDDFKNINYNVWLIFITKIMNLLEKFKELTGIQKKEVLIEFCVIIINRELPIKDDVKLLLETIIRQIFPEIIDSIINLTKKIHTKLTKCSFYQKICKFFKCCNSIDSIDESIVELVVDPVVEPVVEQVVEPVVESTVDPTVELVI